MRGIDAVTMRKSNIDEARVLDLYAQLKSCKKVATAIGGVSDETVRRVLIRNGVVRRKRRPNKEPHHGRLKKYCPALAAMAISVGGMTTSEVAKAFDIPLQSVNNILTRKYPHLKTKHITAADCDLDAIERDYLSGVSTYDIAKKWGVCHGTIAEWMKARGHDGPGRGYVSEATREKRAAKFATINAKRREKRRTEFSAWLQEENAGMFALAGWDDDSDKALLQCKECGHVFSRFPKTDKHVRCPNCAARSMGGSQHVSIGGHRKRCKRYGAKFDKTVTLSRVIERDGNRCQICGCECNDQDLTYGCWGPTYPTIDHIVPLSKGGNHTMENVQLACARCNTKKSNTTGVKHAEEQAVTNECA